MNFDEAVPSFGVSDAAKGATGSRMLPNSICIYWSLALVSVMMLSPEYTVLGFLKCKKIWYTRAYPVLGFMAMSKGTWVK
jgi:hypothetical protein